jgi:ArsR family metal-binding transcriptional regulator
MAILKALEQIPQLGDLTDRIVAIYTDNEVTIVAIKNHSIHNKLVEEIRDKV